MPERILADDVQKLLRRVTITPDRTLSAAFPDKMPAMIEVEMEDGYMLSAVRDYYHGFYTRPFDWTAAHEKFDRVTESFLIRKEQNAIADAIAALEERPITDLTVLLGRVRQPSS